MPLRAEFASMERFSPAFIVGFMLLTFPFYWCFICAMIARMGGWRRLAEIYPDQGVRLGKPLWLQSGFFARARYKGTLNLCAEPDGLALSILLPFRFGHRPIRIPWGDLELDTSKAFLIGELVEVRARKAADLTLKLPASTWKNLQKAGGGIVPSPAAWLEAT